MGLKTSNYNVKDMGITLPTAYAQITHLSIDLNGNANAIFTIQQNRDMISTNEAIDTKHIRCDINKEEPIYEQIYIIAKQAIFEGWEDDIIESEVEA